MEKGGREEKFGCKGGSEEEDNGEKVNEEESTLTIELVREVEVRWT